MKLSIKVFFICFFTVILEIFTYSVYDYFSYTYAENYESIVLNIDDVIQIKVGEIIYIDIDDYESLKVLDNEIANISSDGYLEGLGLGETKLVVSYQDKTEETYNIIINDFSSINSINKEPKKVKKIKLNATNVNLYVNSKTSLKASISPTNASNKKIKWTSSNSSIVSVNSKGEIKGQKKGKAKITAEAMDGSNAKFTTTVNVTQVGIKSITISKKNISVCENGRTLLNYTILPNDASNKNVVWKTSNPNIVNFATTSDGSIYIYGVKAGTATITVHSHDNEEIQYTSNIEVVKTTKGQCMIETNSKYYNKTFALNNRTYKNFDQTSYGSTAFAGSCTLEKCGCGPSALAIMLSGYIDGISPKDTAKVMKYTDFDSLARAAEYYGFRNTYGQFFGYSSLNPNTKTLNSLAKKIREHLKKGYPIIALIDVAPESLRSKCPSVNKYTGGSHFIAILGEMDGKLIIGNSSHGKATSGTVEELLSCYMPSGSKRLLFLTPPKKYLMQYN